MPNKCHIADGVCEPNNEDAVTVSADISERGSCGGLVRIVDDMNAVHFTTDHGFVSKETLIIKAVDILNEATAKVVGAPNYMHWPLLFAADPHTTDIECFMQKDAVTTNLLGVINGFLAYKDSAGIYHRLAYSVEESRYFIATAHVENSGVQQAAPE